MSTEKRKAEIEQTTAEKRAKRDEESRALRQLQIARDEEAKRVKERKHMEREAKEAKRKEKVRKRQESDEEAKRVKERKNMEREAKRKEKARKRKEREDKWNERKRVAIEKEAKRDARAAAILNKQAERECKKVEQEAAISIKQHQRLLKRQAQELVRLESVAPLLQQQNGTLTSIERQRQESLSAAVQCEDDRREALLANRAKNRKRQHAYRARRKTEDQIQLQLEGELPEVDILPPPVDSTLFNGSESHVDERDAEENVEETDDAAVVIPLMYNIVQEAEETKDADDAIAIPFPCDITHDIKETKDNQTVQGGYNTMTVNEEVVEENVNDIDGIPVRLIEHDKPNDIGGFCQRSQLTSFAALTQLEQLLMNFLRVLWSLAFYLQ